MGKYMNQDTVGRLIHVIVALCLFAVSLTSHSTLLDQPLPLTSHSPP